MKYDGFTAPVWTGLTNWHYVFSAYPFFWPALRNTLWLVVVVVTLRVAFGLAVGLLIIKIKRGAGVFRTLFYAPYLAPPVAATMAFVFLLNPGTGPVNTILGKLGLPQPGWFNDPSWSKPALTLLALWGIGDLMIIFMASLLDVPREQYEAAELDGAGAVRRFRFVTLAQHQADPGLRRRHRRDPDDAVLHRAVRRGEGRERADRRLRPAGRARLPEQVDADAAPARLQPRVPAVRHRRRVRGGARALRVGDGLRGDADAPWQRLPGDGGLSA